MPPGGNPPGGTQDRAAPKARKHIGQVVPFRIERKLLQGTAVRNTIVEHLVNREPQRFCVAGYVIMLNKQPAQERSAALPEQLIREGSLYRDKRLLGAP